MSDELENKSDQHYTLKVSDQLLSALMLALQKSLSEQTDIVPELRRWRFQVVPLDNEENYELYVLNPPLYQLTGFDDDEIEEIETEEL